jgi:hypothetical protein
MKYINNFLEYKKNKIEKAIYRVNDNNGNTYYSSDYVKWLEDQLTIPAVVKSLLHYKTCEFCKLPTDGKKCYSKRCPV